MESLEELLSQMMDFATLTEIVQPLTPILLSKTILLYHRYMTRYQNHTAIILNYIIE